MGAQQHQSNSRTLDRRTLGNDHRCLAHLLRPGMTVLDVGCGTGAITMGIAQAVGPIGIAIGVDRDAELIARASARSPSTPNLHFARGDAVDLCFQRRFDIVTAARTLQWIEDLPRAITGMARAAKLNGRLVVLDYNHTFTHWQPDPPEAFTVFYEAFLAWRRSHGWSNEMGHQLPGLFAAAGLIEIHATAHDARSHQRDPDFAVQTSIWTDVIDNLGPTLTASGFCNPARVTEARRVYEQWRTEKLRVQTLSMTCVAARVPSA
jgi:SAM-dependent methyltransferase